MDEAVTADVVVAGAGHNALITAAYLAASGREVVVLESRPTPGGGAKCEELLGPGYAIDSCSTGHTLIQANPLLVNDELGLLERHGLEYLMPDPFAHVAFPDGRQLTTWLDLDRTCEEISRFSDADAHAYRRLIAEYDDVKHIFTAANFTPVGFGPGLEQRLRDHPRGNMWLRRRTMSAWTSSATISSRPTSRPSCCGRRTRRSCRLTCRALAPWPPPWCSAASGGHGRSREAGPAADRCDRRVDRGTRRHRPLRAAGDPPDPRERALRRCPGRQRRALSRPARRSFPPFMSSTCSTWRRGTSGRRTSCMESRHSTWACPAVPPTC